MTYDGRRLGPAKPILTGIPNGFIHDGGRLLFAPDGNLFVSTGETGDEQLAQDRDSLGGKILRITPEGKPAPGNPVEGSPVWTMGHRNVQGLAFDGDGQLWASEFGQDTWDELNRIDKARNYGWPLEEGRGDDPRVPQPVRAVADLRGLTVRARLPRRLAVGRGSAGRPAVAGARRPTAGPAGRRTGSSATTAGCARSWSAPDGNLWVTTSNRDGRGDPGPDDDRILVVDPG